MEAGLRPSEVSHEALSVARLQSAGATELLVQLVNPPKKLRGRGELHLLETHFTPVRTGQAAWRVLSSGSPLRRKLYQKRASCRLGMQDAFSSVNTVPPPCEGCDIYAWGNVYVESARRRELWRYDCRCPDPRRPSSPLSEISTSRSQDTDPRVVEVRVVVSTDAVIRYLQLLKDHYT